MCRKSPAVWCDCKGAHPANATIYAAYIRTVEKIEAKLANSQPKIVPRYVPAPPPKENAWKLNKRPRTGEEGRAKNPGHRRITSSPLYPSHKSTRTLNFDTNGKGNNGFTGLISNIFQL
ncbi:hypothetical protein JTB14_011524 [Gonioctena quinquepunctata]|nr:hypothetical protein JTB14_011524 [Gonioctena quinquepunctata]